MSEVVDESLGERMELPAYYQDFETNFWKYIGFWKLERGQTFAEPGDASWEAFDRGDWERALDLLEHRRPDLTGYHSDISAAGSFARRIRIVELPLTPYLQWELHLLRLRDATGGPIRILMASEIAELETDGPLPEIYTMGTEVMYQAKYDDRGVLAYALRYTDPEVVDRCRRLIASLYDRGEAIAQFFDREVAPLHPARPSVPSLPPGYLEETGRPAPIRS